MNAHFFVRSGYEYYANARFAMHAQTSYVCGNLFHHAVEMLLKADLAKSGRSLDQLTSIRHKPQIAMAEQLGLRKIIADTFHTLWWVPEGSPAEVVTGYLRALDRAEKAMDADLEKYLPLWKLAIPAEFENTYPWDFARFGRGERFVYQTMPRSEFDEVMAQVKRWELDQYLKDTTFENLAADLTAGRFA